MSSRSLLLAIVLLLAGAGPSAAQTVKLAFADGRVHLVAENAPVRQILAEWARLGGTRIVNGDRIPGPPVTLELTGYPERQALEIILRGVPGYMVSVRDTVATGTSYFDRIMILPTTTTVRPSAPAPVASFVQPTPQLPMFPQDDADVDPSELPVGATRRPGAGTVVIGGTPGAIVIQPSASQPGEAPARPAPAPGTPGFGNPFTTLPGSSRPGEITPVPQQDNRPGGAPNDPNSPGAVR